ncbi:NUDIX hydrolase [Lactococcus garvieae]|uniref:ADP-ribose pyrophosphatase n=1 Tax=Lactococcus garvieae DCC43 TaxID=1231377 RepID=K2PLV4_9LACT|nr:NUDIX hydrolase [Lactococcus garvieae]EKF52340.1 ADP-ribose pyrophosphatase [Lactococcus garvieae DCC43]
MPEYNEKKFEESTLSREQIFHGQIFRVVKDLVSLPDGSMSSRELVFHNGGVAVAPITGDKLILVGQYRKAFEKFIFEVPAGKLEDDELNDPKAAALRELEEETGYTAERLTEITSFYGTPGFSSEKTYLYFPVGLTKVESPRLHDEGEFLEMIEVTLPEAKMMIEAGQICDAKTIMAVWYWELQNLKKQGDLDV